MIGGRRSFIAIPAVLASLVVAAGCAATTPDRSALPTGPRPPDGPSAAPSAGRSVTPAPTPAASRDAPASTPEGLAALEIESISSELSGAVLTFATDGLSILFASDRADDAKAGSAPDLWRVVPPGDDPPELVWRNPDRGHSIVGIGGDVGTIAWVETPVTGERAWNLWLLSRAGGEAILLDSHPGDESVSSLVPSFSIYENTIVWSAFDRGPSGSVSQLKVASGPGWEPSVLAERDAREAELWLPSLYGAQLAYTEVRYAPDRSSDERHVYLLSLGSGEEPRRLDTSGRATMPLSVDGAVLWKETDPGFNMFNWGRMVRHDLATGSESQLTIQPQEYVNYPTAGSRYLAWWGADAFAFGIYDLRDDKASTIVRYPTASQENVLRPYVAGDLLVWLHVDTDAPGGPTSELRYAVLPPLKPNPKDG